MYLYKLTQTINNHYDTYDSVIVCAENEEEARRIHPSSLLPDNKDAMYYDNGRRLVSEFNEDTDDDTWVEFNPIDQIKVEYIGEASKNLKKGVVLASFNAG